MPTRKSFVLPSAWPTSAALIPPVARAAGTSMPSAPSAQCSAGESRNGSRTVGPWGATGPAEPPPDRKRPVSGPGTKATIARTTRAATTIVNQGLRPRAAAGAASR
ncbi:hypothetical protein [Streptomyces sp. SA3_actF]|uniref:hypothetical protein n=1 Tax=Streptomyces sp. SA3_actF TaxID=682181 RepID=UPI00020000FD|nr:hypothetical protein [Streptomyces sp. SA3_actF]